MQINKKYVFIGTLVTILLLVATLFIVWMVTLQHTQDTHHEKVDRFSSLAVEHGPIESVTDSFEFNGENAYFVYLGENNEDVSHYVFVPKNEEVDEIFSIEQEEGLTKNQMEEQWKADCSGCNLVSMSPGVLNDQYIWEIIYTTNERYYFQNYRFSDGEIYDSISFSKND